MITGAEIDQGLPAGLTSVSYSSGFPLQVRHKPPAGLHRAFRCNPAAFRHQSIKLRYNRYKKLKAPIKIGARMNSNRPSENIFTVVK